MGQPITVVEKPSSRPGIVRFEINRSLTGMGHERYRSPDDVQGHRPVDELARRLFQHDAVDAVHVNSSVITVDLKKGRTSVGLAEAIEQLFLYYGDNSAPQEPGEPGASEGVASEEVESPAAP